MKNFRQIFLIVAILSFSSSIPSFASTATVNVQSTTNTSSNSTTTTTGSTHIRIETNGVVKECDSKDGDCTYMESDDGSSKVNINNGSVAKPTSVSEVKETVTPTPLASNSAKTIISQEKKIIQEQEEHSIIQEIKDFIKGILESLNLKF